VVVERRVFVHADIALMIDSVSECVMSVLLCECTINVCVDYHTGAPKIITANNGNDERKEKSHQRQRERE